jgi:hypothetical protein
MEVEQIPGYPAFIIDILDDDPLAAINPIGVCAGNAAFVCRDYVNYCSLVRGIFVQRD